MTMIRLRLTPFASISSVLFLSPIVIQGFSITHQSQLRPSRRFLSDAALPDDDLSRWEQLYAMGGTSKVSDTEGFTDNRSCFVGTSSPVRVVSFDLDNTLWKTGPTIQAANDVLAQYLDEKQIAQPERVEKVMGNLFGIAKSTYAPLRKKNDDDDPKSPVLLTQLRKDAIRLILEEHNGYSPKEATAFAETAFQIWTTARHEALPDHFADSVIECLRRIRQIQSSSSPVLVGAITDGNSDPRTVPLLAEFFDFVVNAECVGIAKPDPRVYMAAIQQVARHPHVADIFESVDDLENEDLLQDAVGPWWIHVGDDFLKDIVAAKDLGMRTIWTKELLTTQEQSTTAVPSKQKKSTEEFVRDIAKQLAENQVVEMTVGADDYLAASLQDEFADATVAFFTQVGETLVTWHNEANTSSNSNVDISSTEDTMPSPPVRRISAVEATTTSLEGAKKFCTSCGTKLPLSATFCSSCGTRQAEIG